MIMRFLIVCFVGVATAGAQNRTSSDSTSGFGVITGFVFDSTTGQPVARAVVCSYADVRVANRGATRCAHTDDRGRYRLDSLRAGRYVPFAMCEVGAHRPSVALGARSMMDSIPVRVGMVTDGVLFVVRDSSCRDPDQPRPRFVRGVFRGGYAGGTDYRGSAQSEFTPCPADPWPAQPDSARPAARAWVSWSPLLLKFGGLSILRTDRHGIEGQLWYFVRWRGVVVGPKRSGPYGSYSYELVVDSILEARTPGERDCT